MFLKLFSEFSLAHHAARGYTRVIRDRLCGLVLKLPLGASLILILSEILLTRFEHGKYSKSKLRACLARNVKLILDHDLLCDPCNLRYFSCW